MKNCTCCQKEKPETEFHVYSARDKHKTGGLHAKCKACEHSARMEHRKKNPLLVAANSRKYKLRAKYGITPEAYDSLLNEQKGVCAICERTSPDGRRLHVDHCHETNRVRGLLCHDCNRGIGMFRDEKKLLKKAAEYLD